MNLNYRVGILLRLERLKQDLTQQEVADAAELTREAISMIERGKRMNLDTLVRIANDGLGIPFSRIVKKSEELGSSYEILAAVESKLAALEP